MINTRVSGAASAAVLTLLCNGAAQAAGYQVQEQSVKGLGHAFAGGAAIAEDASTVMYNPAGLTRLQRQVELGNHIIIPRSEFSDQNSSNVIGGRPVGRKDGEDGGKAALVPNFFYANPFNDRITFGFGISSLYGLATEYPDDWIGRYHAIESELITLNINPALGFQINDQWSIGAGVSAQYADATLSNALDFGGLVTVQQIQAGDPLTLAPSDPRFDGKTEVVGDDWGFGFNLGVLFQPNPGTRFGIGYRSKIDHTLTGDNDLTIPDIPEILALAGPSRSRDAEASVTIPATLSFSGYHELSSRWAVMADVTWTDWSEFDELRVEFSNDPVDPDPSDSVQPEEWEDAFRYSLGVNYRYSDALTFRAGVAYDETPVPSAKLRTPRIPDNSRRWITLGASYRPSETFSFDIAYAHIFVSDTRINDTEVTTGGLAGAPVGSTLDGEYEASVDILSAQVQWNF